MARVTGIGGVFLRSKNPKRLSAWYIEHLGLPATEWGVFARQLPAYVGSSAPSFRPVVTNLSESLTIL